LPDDWLQLFKELKFIFGELGAFNLKGLEFGAGEGHTAEYRNWQWPCSDDGSTLIIENEQMVTASKVIPATQLLVSRITRAQPVMVWCDLGDATPYWTTMQANVGLNTTIARISLLPV